MTDDGKLVERLRTQSETGLFDLPAGHTYVSFDEAADRIEAQAERIEKLEAALNDLERVARHPGQDVLFVADLIAEKCQQFAASRKDLPMKGANGQEVVILDINGPREIDVEIAPIVKALNDAGIETVASCSGHGFRPGSIILRDGRELIIAKVEEARKIDALFPLDINGNPVGASKPDAALQANQSASEQAP